MNSIAIPSKTSILIKDFLHSLQQKIPIESQIQLSIAEKGHGFCGLLNIKSINLTFAIECVEEQISEVIDLLSAQCNVEIQAWLRDRVLIP